MAYVPKACGFVVAREGDEGLAYLLLESRRWSEVGFPKGHVHPGETEVETARRETLEETGLADVDPLPGFRRALVYPVTRKGKVHEKEAVYFAARPAAGTVRLSDEHTEAVWVPYADALARLPYDSLRDLLREAALFLKDPALFVAEPTTEAAADDFLCALPDARDLLVAHLRGGARLARAFAEQLARAGTPVRVEPAAVGALLHDAGRAIGRHQDHPIAGTGFLRTTALAPYAFACISHFTKGASREAMAAAGIAAEDLDRFEALIDISTLTWEERCVALADACMDRDRPVPPAERFESLRRRYDTHAFIALQEARAAVLRAEIEAATGEDPLRSVGLDG